MKIEVLYFGGCPNHEPTVKRVRQVAQRLGFDVRIEEVEVTERDDAAALKFAGSPTVLINGQDINPALRGGGSYGYGCRTYSGGGVPPEALIEAAIRSASGHPSHNDIRAAIEKSGCNLAGQ